MTTVGFSEGRLEAGLSQPGLKSILYKIVVGVVCDTDIGQKSENGPKLRT